MRVRTDTKRKEIVDVAAKVFADLGYNKASMSVISAELGGSKATLYGYFKSKEQLFAAVLMDALEEHGNETFQILEDVDGDMGEILRTFGRSYLTFVTRPEVMSLERSAMTGELCETLAPEIYQNGPQRGALSIQAYIDAQIKAGRLIAKDAHIPSLQLRSLLEGGVKEPMLYSCPPHLEIEEAVDSAVDAFLKLYAV